MMLLTRTNKMPTRTVVSIRSKLKISGSMTTNSDHQITGIG
ncbi:hypothetical protein [Lactobacillus xylocopicola]|nr:hypothetical protein [Lactobacillus xylocopicola]